MKFSAKLNSIIFFLIVLSSFFTMNSCFIGIFNDQEPDVTDISFLPEKYFICDSLDRTPVVFTLTWEPKENDSVFIELSGGICSMVEMKSGWLKDKVIQINVDAKQAAGFSAIMLFGLSSSQEYKIHCNFSLEGKYLLDQDCTVHKREGEAIAKRLVRVYLPIHKIHKFRSLGEKIKLCWDHPKSDIFIAPEYVDSLETEKAYDITDYFTLSLESCNANVSFYDKSLNKKVGNQVKARANDFRKYQVILNEPYNSEMDDTIFVLVETDDFISKHKMVVAGTCAINDTVKDVIVKFDQHRINDGDTLSAYIYHTDKNGNCVRFADTTRFEAGIMIGCNFADILGPNGQLKKYFYDIRQPIRVVAMDPIPDGETNLRIRVGLIPDWENPYNPDN